MHRTLTFAFAALSWLGALGSAASARSPAEGPPRPNILVIVGDDMGWSDVHPAVRTPNLVNLAQEGVTFRRAYAMPYCSPSRFALLFGMQPFREGLGTYIDTNDLDDVSVSRSRLALPRVLDRAGYRTMASGKWHLSTFAIGVAEASEWPRQFGFQAFRAGRIGNLGQTVTYTSWPRIDDGVLTNSTEYNTTAVRRAASEWWTATPGPKFAYVAFHAPHSPYHVPPAMLLPPGRSVGSDNRSRYEAMVEALDVEIGKLLSVVDLDDTLVVFLADNGTPTEACARGQTADRVKGSVYEGGIRVPLIVAGWGAARGRTSEALVSATDLFATILELAHLPRPDGYAIDSVSFAPQIYVPELAGRDWVYSQTFAPNGPGPKTTNARAVVGKRYKLIADGRGERVHDLERDPGETQPLPMRGANLWIRDRLREQMNAMVAQGAP